MYPVSQLFHEAVESQSAKRLLLNFGDLVLGATDIATGGAKFTETFNPDIDLAIGNAPETAFEAVIINRDQLLSGYDFAAKEFTASIGVHISDTDYSGLYAQIYAVSGLAPKLACMTGNRLYALHVSAPYLTAYSSSGGFLTQVNVSAPASAPGCIVIDGGNVRLGFPDGTMTDLSGGDIALYPFMQKRVREWCEQGLCAWMDGNNLHEYALSDTNAWIDSIYEFCPLGVFIPERPETVLTYTIHLTAKDRLSRFDVSVDAWFNNIVFPQTLGALAASLCADIGEPLASATFLNSGMAIDQRRVFADQWTGRDVLRWIAEAACSTARMNRDGALEFAWFDDANYTVKTRFSYKRAEYAVPVIDGLSVVGSDNDIGANIPDDGSAATVYRITDNPFLAGDTDASIRQMTQPIFDRLTAFQAYSPVTVRTKGDWSVCAGDIITVLDGFTEEHVLPIFSQTLTFTGSVRITYESTGSPERSAEARANRQRFATERRMTELRIGVEGINARVSEINTEMQEVYSELDVQAGQIGLVVGNDKLVGGDGALNASIIVTAINESTIQIQADNINLAGYVTFTSLLASGGTTINGDNITTGTLNADLIKSGSIQPGSGQSLKIAGFTVSLTTLSGENISISSADGRIAFGDYGSIYPSGNQNALIIASPGTIYLNAPSVNIGNSSGRVYIKGVEYNP